MFFYSFTQIDLGLTLSRISIWQTAERFFKNIGYFQRPFSSLLFTLIILLLFTFYLLILNAVRKKTISKRTVLTLIIATSVILAFSYNAFSYDFFNYIFDAKIIIHYQQNPYLHKALDFPGDPMLSFMHWTQRLYPYGPIWLGITVPLSFLGMQLFLPTFFLFKIMISACFLGTAFFIGKILHKSSPENELFGVAFFALNPLVIIESLVSAHNDTAMMFLALWGLYLLMSMKNVRSIILLILSIGVKFATAMVLPVYLWIQYLQKQKKNINWQIAFTAITGLMIVPVVLATFRTNFQPWYLLDILAFAALVSKNYYIIIPSLIISFFAIFEYLPFLYTGNWNNPIPLILFWMTIGAVFLSFLLTLAWRFKKVLR